MADTAREATAYREARLRHDLREAGLDADRYAMTVTDILSMQTPSEVMADDAMRLTLLIDRLVRLIGSLEMGRTTRQRLREMGVIV